MKIQFAAILFALSALLVVPLARADGPLRATGTFTGPTSAPVRLSGLTTQRSCVFAVTGTAGPLKGLGSVFGANWWPLGILDFKWNPVEHTQPFTATVNTLYQLGPIAGLEGVEIAPDATWGVQNATIALRCSDQAAIFPQPAVAPTIAP